MSSHKNQVKLQIFKILSCLNIQYPLQLVLVTKPKTTSFKGSANSKTQTDFLIFNFSFLKGSYSTK